jgi:hypothetical protein
MNKQMQSDLTLQLQFLEAHRKQYKALAADFAGKIETHRNPKWR